MNYHMRLKFLSNGEITREATLEIIDSKSKKTIHQFKTSAADFKNEQDAGSWAVKTLSSELGLRPVPMSVTRRNYGGYAHLEAE